MFYELGFAAKVYPESTTTTKQLPNISTIVANIRNKIESKINVQQIIYPINLLNNFLVFIYGQLLIISYITLIMCCISNIRKSS